MPDRHRQMNVHAGLTLLVVALLVVTSVGAVFLVGTASVAAQSNETGDTGSDASNGDGATTGAPPDGGSSNDSASRNETSSTTESKNNSGGDGGSGSDRVGSALPDSDSGTGTNETANESDNESGSTDSSGRDTYTQGEDDDDSMFSISIDPVGLLISFFEPWFTLGTDILTAMAEALQSSTQYPERNGTLAADGEPDGALMSTLYGWWLSVGLIVGGVIWLLFMIILYLLLMIWPPTSTYQQMLVAKQEAWLKLFLIPFSWSLGAIILFAASFALNMIPLNPQTIAPDTSSIAANNAAAGISVLLFYAFGGAFALAMAFTFFVTWLYLYIIFPALPILMAMSVPKAWIMKDVAEAFESVLKLFPSAAFFPLPAVVVLSIGYTAIGAFENHLPGPAEWGAVPVSAVAIIVIWGLALFSSVYLFWFKRVGSGVGAVMAGTVGIGAISSALSSLRGGAAAGSAAAGGAAGSAAGSTVGSSATAIPGSAENAVNGHALGSGSSSGSSGALDSNSGSSSALSSGSSDPNSGAGGAPATAGTATGSNPSGTAIPSGSGSSSGSGSDSGSGAVAGTQQGAPSGAPTASDATASAGSSDAPNQGGSMPSRIPVDDPEITTVESENDLPDQEYRVGYFTGSGPGSDMEFQKMLGTDRSPDVITGDTYARVEEAREDRDLFVRGQDDQQFYDVSPVHESGENGLDLSEGEQTAESRSTVDDARRM